MAKELLLHSHKQKKLYSGDWWLKELAVYDMLNFTSFVFVFSDIHKEIIRGSGLINFYLFTISIKNYLGGRGRRGGLHIRFYLIRIHLLKYT